MLGATSVNHSLAVTWKTMRASFASKPPLRNSLCYNFGATEAIDCYALSIPLVALSHVPGLPPLAQYLLAQRDLLLQ